MKRSTKWPGSSLTERFSLENPSVGCCPTIFYSFRKPAPEKEQVLCLSSFRGCPKRRNIRSISKFSTFHALSKIWRLHIGFNYSLEKKNFDRQWSVLRKQYEDAGMSIEVIQAMYEYDWSVFNAAHSYQNHTQEIAAPSFEQGEEAYSPLMNKYQESICDMQFTDVAWALKTQTAINQAWPNAVFGLRPRLFFYIFIHNSLLLTRRYNFAAKPEIPTWRHFLHPFRQCHRFRAKWESSGSRSPER